MHVAAEVGFWTNPHVLRLARELREPLAGAYVLRLREFFLLHGRKGTVRDYSAEDLAAAIGWPHQPAKLIKALTEVRVLGRRRSTWLYLGWFDTQTGRWVRELEEDAAAARARRERRRAELAEGGSGGGSDETASGDVARRRATSPAVAPTSGQKEGRKEDAHPAPNPPQGGGAAPSVPWETFRNAYPSERYDNLPAAQRHWERLTPEEQAAAMAALPAALLSMSRKKRVKWARIDRFVVDRGWERFGPVQTAPARVRNEAPKEPTPDPESERREEIRRRRFVLLGEIKRELKSRGLRGDELARKADERLEREWPEGEDEPRPAGPFLVTVADGVTVQ
jgi:hypothetical protein